MHVSDRMPAARRAPEPPADGMTWSWLAWQMRLHRENFIPPPHLRGLPLAHVEARAREEQVAERAAEEARRQATAHPEIAPAESPEIAPSGTPAAPPREVARSAGWRLRGRYLAYLRRGASFREAAARTGIDESTARRWRRTRPLFAAQCAGIVAERHAERSDDFRLRAGQPRVRPHFYRGKQVGEQVVHDDRPLMFLLKLEDGQRARAEAHAFRAEENRLQRAHEIRLKEMEIAARREDRAQAAAQLAQKQASQAQPSPAQTSPAQTSRTQASERQTSDLARRLAAADARMLRIAEERARRAAASLPASAAQPPSPANDRSARDSNALDVEPADSGPLRIVEVPDRSM